MSVPRLAKKSTCKIREIDKPGLPVINEDAADTPVLLRGPNMPHKAATPSAQKPQRPPTKRNLYVVYSDKPGCTVAQEVGVKSVLPIRVAFILPGKFCDHMVEMQKKYAMFARSLPPLENYITPYDLCSKAIIIPVEGGKFDTNSMCQLGKVLTLLYKTMNLVESGKIQNSVLGEAIYGYYTTVIRLLTNVWVPFDSTIDGDLGPNPSAYAVLRNHIYRYCVAVRESVAHPKEAVSYSTYLTKSRDPLVFKVLNSMVDAAIEEVTTSEVL